MFIIIAFSLMTIGIASSSNYNSKSNYYPPGDGDYPDNHHDCGKVRFLSVSGHDAVKADIKHLKKHGKEYVFISCPNDSTAYVLVAGQTGKSVALTPAISNAAILGNGFNIGVLAKCKRHGKFSAKISLEQEKIKFKRVACVKAPQTLPDSL